MIGWAAYNEIENEEYKNTGTSTKTNALRGKRGNIEKMFNFIASG